MVWRGAWSRLSEELQLGVPPQFEQLDPQKFELPSGSEEAHEIAGKIQYGHAFVQAFPVAPPSSSLSLVLGEGLIGVNSTTGEDKREAVLLVMVAEDDNADPHDAYLGRMRRALSVRLRLVCHCGSGRRFHQCCGAALDLDGCLLAERYSRRAFTVNLICSDPLLEVGQQFSLLPQYPEESALRDGLTQKDLGFLVRRLLHMSVAAAQHHHATDIATDYADQAAAVSPSAARAHAEQWPAWLPDAVKSLSVLAWTKKKRSVIFHLS